MVQMFRIKSSSRMQTYKMTELKHEETILNLLQHSIGSEFGGSRDYVELINRELPPHTLTPL